ncbi:MAG: methionyl-tRNA formyltransferase [Chloroflexota bacterium]
MRTVFLGSGTFAVPILDALAAFPGVRLVGVVTTPARPAGRDAALRPTPVAVRAAALDLPLLTPDRLRDPAAQAAIAALAPDLLVLADYGRIVPQALLDLPPHGALNLHPSLLPRHRGATPIPAAIAAGDAETGVSLMRMDAGVDTGPLIASVRVPLDGTEEAPALEEQLAVIAGALLVRSLPAWLDGSLPAVPQATEGATLTRPLKREDARLEPSRPAAELARRIRAFQPWPGAWVETTAGRLIVGAAHAGPRVVDQAPGTLVALGPDVALVTADATLILDVVQPAGKKPMAGRDHRRGRRDLSEAVAATAG